MDSCSKPNTNADTICDNKNLSQPPAGIQDNIQTAGTGNRLIVK